jgi:hypothetical protein
LLAIGDLYTRDKKFALASTPIEPCHFTSVPSVGLPPKARLSLSYPLQYAEAVGRKMLEKRDAAACGMSYALVARRDNQTLAKSA